MKASYKEADPDDAEPLVEVDSTDALLDDPAAKNELIDQLRAELLD